jgi:hypothetical protein
MNLNKSITIKTMILSSLVLLPGCMKQIQVSSNTFADKTLIPCGFAEGQTFSISSVNSSHQLFEKETSQKIASMLEEMGYEIELASPADFDLYYRYETTSSREVINTPKYIPGTEQRTCGTGNAYGNGYTPFGCYHNSESVHYKETTTTSGSIIYVPETVTIFTHKISIDVYRVNPFLCNKKKELVWQGSAICCDRSGDCRYIIDYLLKSIFKHFGKDTKKNVHKEYIDL